jgi:hypothetical protein
MSRGRIKLLGRAADSLKNQSPSNPVRVLQDQGKPAWADPSTTQRRYQPWDSGSDIKPSRLRFRRSHLPGRLSYAVVGIDQGNVASTDDDHVRGLALIIRVGAGCS